MVDRADMSAVIEKKMVEVSSIKSGSLQFEDCARVDITPYSSNSVRLQIVYQIFRIGALRDLAAALTTIADVLENKE